MRSTNLLVISMLSGLFAHQSFDFGGFPVNVKTSIPIPNSFGKKRKLKGWQKKRRK